MVSPDADRSEAYGWRAGFGEYVLGGILVLMVAGLALTVFFYLLPPSHLELEELQPALRVSTEADLPVSESRILNWGDDVVLVVRTGKHTYAALQGTAPTDGCILKWDATSLRVVSPCSYIVYDLHGNVVRGLTTVPLQRYAVFVRDGVVYVARS